MTIYWFLFCIPAFFALMQRRHKDGPPRKTSLLWAVAGLILVLVIGLRHEVGGDWYPYLGQVDFARDVSILDVIAEQKDPAYAILNWIGANVFGGVYFVNFVCALIFVSGLFVFCKDQPRPWLALAVAMPYLVTVVGMGYTRQSVALGLIMLGLVALNKEQIYRFLIIVTIASLFHKSAVILVPLALFTTNKKSWFQIVGILLSAFLLFSLILRESLDLLVENYIGGAYASSGAFIRVFMNAFAALFIIFGYKYICIGLTENIKRFWTWMAWAALVFVVILELSPSSTAVDRIALYWLPLQVFVWSRFPDYLIRSLGGSLALVWFVLIYSASILLIWLNFAVNSFAWIPYQFYPLGEF